MRTLIVAMFVCGCAGAPARSTKNAPLAAALDADLRADWDALLAARAAVAALPDGAARAYHLGYLDWRISSLAYVVGGTRAQLVHLARAVGELQQAAALDPGFVEAQALLAACATMNGALDRTKTDLFTVARGAWDAALAGGEVNPRVQLLRAMNEVFTPKEYGGDVERGLARWRQAIALFEREPAPRDDALAPRWGHAEAWAWLGGAYLTLGRDADAADALRRALALRPDFWWAKTALAQAARPYR